MVLICVSFSVILVIFFFFCEIISFLSVLVLILLLSQYPQRICFFTCYLWFPPVFCPHLCPVVYSYAVRASPLLAVLFLWIKFYFYLPCLCVNHTHAPHDYPWQNESLWNTWPVFFSGKTVMHLFTQMPCLKREFKYWKEIKKRGMACKTHWNQSSDITFTVCALAITALEDPKTNVSDQKYHKAELLLD